MVISDVTAVIDADTFERPIYAGNAIQTVKSSDGKKVFTVRTALRRGRQGRRGPGRKGRRRR
jgi:electron transfer flavoprotein alpha subunit